jgi:hypothetical protein
MKQNTCLCFRSKLTCILTFGLLACAIGGLIWYLNPVYPTVSNIKPFLAPGSKLSFNILNENTSVLDILTQKTPFQIKLEMFTNATVTSVSKFNANVSEMDFEVIFFN